MKNMSISQKAKELIKKHTPQIVTTVGVASFIVSTHIGSQMRTERVYKALYIATGNKFYKMRVMQMTHSNNWLKMHGYPMNRKRNKPKKRA